MRKTPTLLVGLVLLTSAFEARAATCTSTKAGNFNDPTVWSCGSVPSATDSIVINHAVVLNQNYTSRGGLRINSTGSLAQSGTRSLQIGQSTGSNYPGFEIYGSLTVSTLTLFKSTSTLHSTGTLLVTGNLTLDNNGDLVINGGLTVEGNLNLYAGNATSSGSGTMNVQGCISTATGGSLGNVSVPFCVGNQGAGGCGGPTPAQVEANGSYDCSFVLPVEWVSFKGANLGKAVSLQWVTAQEINTSYFMVQRSNDGRMYEDIGYISAAGNSSVPIAYTFEDYAPLEGLAYYRLRQVDMDEASAYSIIVKVDRTEDFSFSVYPNPASTAHTPALNFTGVQKGTQAVVVLYDVLGTEVYTKIVESEDGSYVSLDRPLAGGIYLVVASSDERIHKERIVVSR